ncbi:MAG: 30S ribosomal protein S18 [bacterium]
MKKKNRGNKKENKEERPQRKRRKKVCIFCADKFMPDYKKIDLMKRFVSDRGKILTMRSSGCCARHQRAIAKEIKRARQLSFLPYTVE